MRSQEKSLMHEIEPPHKDVQALPKSREIYKALVTYAQDAVLGVNRKGTIVFWNKGAERVFGYSAEEIAGQPLTKLISQKHNEGHRLSLKAFLGGSCSETRIIEGEALRKDGSTFPVELSFSLEGQNGRFVALAIGRDITKRRQMERALRESAERYCNLFSTCVDTVFSANMADNTEAGNKVVEKLCGYCLGELLEMMPADSLPPERQDYLSRRSDEALSRDEPSSGIVREVLTKEGKRVLAEKYLSSLNVEDGLPGTRTLDSQATEHNRSEELKDSFIKLARVISHVIGFCDPYTANHQERVAELARLVGKNMGLADDIIESLYFNGLLHDIGKISIPRSILTKPGELAEEEWALIRAHTKQGYSILKEADLPWPVAEVALRHHERLDGSGYPNGIGGDELGLEVSILAVCDVVEAMSSHRPYRPARTTAEVLKELIDGRGTKYDAGVVDVMVPKIENGEFRSMWSWAN